jgi:hypothetical protein
MNSECLNKESLENKFNAFESQDYKTSKLGKVRAVFLFDAITQPPPIFGKNLTKKHLAR